MASRRTPDRAARRHFGRTLAWALAGAVVFGLPTLMTMELWDLGSYTDEWRMAAFSAASVAMFFGLAYYLGFEPTLRLRTDLLDAFIAYGIGFVTAGATLALLGIIGPDMGSDEALGRVAIQVFPCGLGALLARKQLRRGPEDDAQSARRRSSSYHGQLFLMAVGAVFLSLNLAPTDEMVIIAHQITSAQAVLLSFVTVAAMHGFVWSSPLYDAAFHAQPRHGWQALALFTVVGYAIALVISAYMLWTFGRLEGMSAVETLKALVVLAFPAVIGAAASRLIL